MSKVTLKDIAEAAGVQPSTVSYILNDSRRGFSPNTVSRIKNLARQMGYQPNAAARNLRTGNSRMIGFLFSAGVDDVKSAVVYQFLAGITAEIQSKGYDLALILDRTGNDPDFAHVERIINEGRVDGLIIQNPFRGGRLLPFLMGRDVPFVVLGRPSIDGLHWVDSDNVGVGGIMANHLLSLGHRRLALITPGPRYMYAADRQRGFVQALRAAGICESDSAIVIVDDDPASAAQAMHQLRAENRLPTAVCTADDRLAAGVIDAVEQMGLSVPHDISVVGCNNMPPVKDGNFLTTIDLRFPEVGQLVARKLLEVLAENGPSLNATVNGELLVRQSTAPPRL
jgi:DNA-binding LacI/PurR family transcriptional regulator